MGVSMFFADQGLQVVGHVLVLLVFVGGGLGAIAWVKQHYGDPLVNVAGALASLGCITVLIKEGSVQAGDFSDDRVLQILLMVLLGVVVATAVNTLVLPVTARRQLTNDLEKNTDLLGELLISITRAFLSGREDLLQGEDFTELQKEHQQSLQKMAKDLGETQKELLVLGSEKLYEVSTRLVECLDGLSQDVGGLRSAALAQFELMKDIPLRMQDDLKTTSSTATKAAAMPNILDVITEAPEETGIGAVDGTPKPPPTTSSAISSGFTTPERSDSIGSINTVLKSADNMFFAFIAQLGPPTKSLVYTLKQILDELPFKDGAEPDSWYIWFHGGHVTVAINENFHSSLRDAVELYRTSRKDALNTLYANRALSAAFMPQGTRKTGAFSRQRTATGGDIASPMETRTPLKSPFEKPAEDVLADIEEVSACCGHFSFSLLDFAEDMLTYLNILDDLKDALESPSPTWKWLMFWRRPSNSERRKFKPGTDFEHGIEHGQEHDIPEPIRKADSFAHPDNYSRPWTWKLYRKLRIFRRDDIKYAIKVGIGAIVYSLPAFIASTRPFFTYWRGEWGLVSYMAVCVMTIGAANTTGLNRFIGTFIGACLAIIAWILSANHGDANPYLLAFFGWAVATGCFYLILAKNQGPMGRFILLTYNLGALYAYSLSVHDDDHDDDEGGIDPAIWDIVLHRLVAVIVGTIWAIIITRLVWPISARRKLKDGLCILWLRMSLVWKRDPLAMFLLGVPKSNYMDIREEAELHSFLTYLDSLRSAAQSEFELRGPFPDKIVGRIIERTRRMLDAFHAMNVTITKDMVGTPGEAAVLRYTREQRFALSARISHLFSVLASSYKLEYPLNDAMPSIETSRDNLLARISEFRRTGEGRDVTTEQDYELLYAYVLVTGQLARDIEAVAEEIETLFGTLNEENLKLQ